jgi:hypothetical protein
MRVWNIRFEPYILMAPNDGRRQIAVKTKNEHKSEGKWLRNKHIHFFTSTSTRRFDRANR